MNIHIRKAVPDDALPLAEILTSSWRSAYEGLIPDEDLEKNTNIGQRTEMFTRMLADPEGEFYIVLDGAKPCGHMMFRYQEEIAEIVAVYTLEEYWGKGVGKIMMETALKEISNAGYDKVFLWVLKDNIRARRFYEKYGFAADGTHKKAFSDEVVEVRYIKGLLNS